MATPTGPFVLRPATPASVLPAKRLDDELQIVAVNPVKKRRLKNLGVAPTPQAFEHSTSVTPSPRPALMTSDPKRPAPKIEQRISTATAVLSSQPPEPPTAWSATRTLGPGFGKLNNLETLWIAPASSLCDSPPLSPKQLPQRLLPGSTRSQSVRGLNVPIKNEGCDGLGNHAFRTVTESHMFAMTPPYITEAAPDPAEDAMTAIFSEATEFQPYGTTEDGLQHEVRVPPTQIVGHVSHVKSNDKKNNHSQSSMGLMCQSPPSQPLSLASRLDFGRGTSFREFDRPQNNVEQPSVAPPNPSTGHDAAASPYNTTSMKDHKDGPKAHGTCMKCLQAKLRQRAAMSATEMQSSLATGSFQASSLAQPAWTPAFNMNGTASGNMMPAAHGQSIPSHFIAGLVGSARQSQFLGHRPLGQNKTRPSPFFSSTDNMLGTLNSQVPIPSTQATTSGKHLIVDIADTCAEVFPFEAIAKRHHQPVQKVRDVFNAIIQVPLLRCPTDKRRAGKLGTARLKDYTQAKKRIVPDNQDRGDRHRKLGQGDQYYSAWDVAKLLGPTDAQLGHHFDSAGPW
ncbi:hypothetical protein BN1723_015199 [Verticillium longisporum]|uniref:Uncharacterized protein n=1 Tax=Verticillium longisporum TaxID=100787 RepID=A0A0G4MTA2_VERLO|nr:hypothetical protein BN1708_006082 [Verticillium longisporum]CRK37414.1 hypothetical protein BN1723_015199 [Verticillium longisporum]